MSKSGKMSAAFTTVAANYYYDTRLYYFSYLQAGSAPASRSSLTAAFCPAAEATCSKVNPDKSTGLLWRVTGLGTSERSLSGRSWPSDVSTGSWRSLRRVSTSPTLQAVNRASLRPYSHDSSTIPKKNHRKLNKSRGRCIFRWLQVSRGTGAIQLTMVRKKHFLTFRMFLSLSFPLPLLWLCLLSGVSWCCSLWHLLYLIVCFCVTQLCHTWIWYFINLAELLSDK